MAVITDKRTHVWLLKEHSSGGPSDKYHVTAFLNDYVAERVANDLKEEWRNWTPEKRSGEEISKDRVIVDQRVYYLNSESDDNDIRKRAISKLNQDELRVLGLD